jgi:hypothetical protein
VEQLSQSLGRALGDVLQQDIGLRLLQHGTSVGDHQHHARRHSRLVATLIALLKEAAKNGGENEEFVGVGGSGRKRLLAQLSVVLPVALQSPVLFTFPKTKIVSLYENIRFKNYASQYKFLF